jgi:8-oxo-dGTP pyrophosphatase MutT (NUDIX family)
VETTWDGLPVSKEKPFGAAVVVWRERAGEREWLVLRRRHAPGPEWKWTPPAGARLPGEQLDDCAGCELLEETGLALDPSPTPCGREDWALYAAQAPPDAVLRLDAEHDDFAWLPLDEAVARCRPQVVADGIACVAAWLASYHSAQPGQL